MAVEFVRVETGIAIETLRTCAQTQYPLQPLWVVTQRVTDA